MPLGKDISANMRELYADNKRSGKERGANGKVRSRAQMIAIAMSAAGKSKSDNKMKETAMAMRAHKIKST